MQTGPRYTHDYKNVSSSTRASHRIGLTRRREEREGEEASSKKLPVFMRVCGVAQLVIESPKPPECHPEREGGGWGGREGSPRKVLVQIHGPRGDPSLPSDPPTPRSEAVKKSQGVKLVSP